VSPLEAAYLWQNVDFCSSYFGRSWQNDKETQQGFLVMSFYDPINMFSKETSFQFEAEPPFHFRVLAYMVPLQRQIHCY